MGRVVRGYTWWPLFSLVDWDYHGGTRSADGYLRHMDLYDLEADGANGFLRVETPVVRAFRSAAENLGKDRFMNKVRETQDDGRYIIFYHSEDEPEVEAKEERE